MSRDRTSILWKSRHEDDDMMVDDDAMMDDMMIDDGVMIDDMMADDDVAIDDGDPTGINTPPQTPPLTVMDTPLG